MDNTNTDLIDYEIKLENLKNEILLKNIELTSLKNKISKLQKEFYFSNFKINKKFHKEILNTIFFYFIKSKNYEYIELYKDNKNINFKLNVFNIKYLNKNKELIIKSKCNVFEYVCYKGDIKLYDILIKSKHINIYENNTYCLQLACEFNKLLIVNNLLEYKNINPTINDHYCLLITCKYGYYKIVNLLLQHNLINPLIKDNYPLQIACEYGNYDTVKLLLNISNIDPTTNEYYSIRVSCENNYFNIVELLLNNDKVNINNLFDLLISINNQQMLGYRYTSIPNKNKDYNILKSNVNYEAECIVNYNILINKILTNKRFIKTVKYYNWIIKKK